MFAGILIIYVKCNRLENQVWRTTSRNANIITCKGLMIYLAVALPSAIIMWAEWWAFEALALIVGTLPDAETQLAAHGTLFNTVTIFYMTFTGLSQAVTATVGKNIGSEKPLQNKLVVWVACVFCGLSSCILCTLLWVCREQIARLFTADKRVVEAVEDAALGIVLSTPIYGFLMTLYGACRGSNRQKTAAIGTAVGYYCFGIPMGYVLGKVLGWPNPLLGVWFGNVLALSFSLVVVIIVIARIDWSNVVATAIECVEEPQGDNSYTAADEAGHFGTS